MKRIAKKSKVGLTRKRLEKFKVNFVEIIRKSEREGEAHEKWLDRIADKLRRHYNRREDCAPKKGWSDAHAFQFFIRDFFYWDTAAMQEVVGQCLDWLEGIHGVDIGKWLKRSKWVELKSRGHRR
jgi:hypothetical protein